MTNACPQSTCLSFRSKAFVAKDGRFYRRCEARFIQRFRCTSCGTRFSHATGTLEFKQRKRSVNNPLRGMLCSGVSMRRSALLLNIHRTTVERKLAYLAKKARLAQQEFLESMKGRVTHLQFDDLVTSEHTKMKPLTVTLAVDASTRAILGVAVARIGASGHLAEISRRKYGKRPNRHARSLEHVFRTVAPTIALGARVESDEHKRYPPFVARYLPGRDYRRYPGGRGSIAGQGELKKKKHDPLFMLNHTCAMLRGCINRLIRRTWCTTKRPRRLQMHLDLYVDFHNRTYLKLC
jgi:transposase-like protein